MADGVTEDSELTPAEKETSINFTKTMDEARIYTEMRALITPLLDNPHFQIEDTRTEDGDVCAVRGKLPISCLTIKGKPRSDENTLSGVASPYTGNGGGE